MAHQPISVNQKPEKEILKNQPTRFFVALFSFCHTLTENLGPCQKSPIFCQFMFELRFLFLKILQKGKVLQNMQSLSQKCRITMNRGPARWIFSFLIKMLRRLFLENPGFFGFSACRCMF